MIPSAAQVAATERLFGLYALARNAMFGKVMPTAAAAAAQVKRLLNVGDGHVVEFCRNSHEITRHDDDGIAR